MKAILDNSCTTTPRIVLLPFSCQHSALRRPVTFDFDLPSDLFFASLQSQPAYSRYTSIGTKRIPAAWVTELENDGAWVRPERDWMKTESANSPGHWATQGRDRRERGSVKRIPSPFSFSTRWRADFTRNLDSVRAPADSVDGEQETRFLMRSRYLSLASRVAWSWMASHDRCELREGVDPNGSLGGVHLSFAVHSLVAF